MLSDEEIKKYGLSFKNALEELVEKLKHKKITRENHFSYLIEDLEEGLTEVHAGDIIVYILSKGLNEKHEIYSKIIEWCYKRLSKDKALIFAP